MRFSAAIQPQQPLRIPTPADFMRRLVSNKPLEQPQPPPAPRVDELPADLDQRVRLVGEW